MGAEHTGVQTTCSNNNVRASRPGPQHRTAGISTDVLGWSAQPTRAKVVSEIKKQIQITLSPEGHVLLANETQPMHRSGNIGPLMEYLAGQVYLDTKFIT